MEIIEKTGTGQVKKKLRVCAYCRVSTDADEQENSLENQMQHYEDAIRSNSEYDFAGVYHDFAISGYKEKRPGFQKMLADAKAGLIDLIITKSVSRFARNTAVLLKATRELKEQNVGVFFELQNINTLSGEGELMLTIIAAFAQAESESGSEGAKMVYRRKYEAGIPVQYLERSFGYRKGENGEYVPDEKEAVWVKKMFNMAAEGYTPAAITRHLNAEGVKTVQGAEWSDSAVFRILDNEIYKGDYIMHKHFVNEERKLVKNRGEADAWYVENDHKPIVSKSLWEKAQESLQRKREYLAAGSVIEEFTEENYPYMKHVFCAECGFPLYYRIYSNGNRLNWGCSGTKRHGKKFCEGVNVPDSVIRGWEFDGNIYIKMKDDSKGIKEFSFIKESSWKRRHRKKKYDSGLPKKATLEEYPYKNNLFCGKCGYRLTRVVCSDKAVWVCSGSKHKGKLFCQGIRIPDEIIKKNVTAGKDVYIMERKDRHGEKHYSYSGEKPQQDKEQRYGGKET